MSQQPKKKAEPGLTPHHYNLVALLARLAVAEVKQNHVDPRPKMQE